MPLTDQELVEKLLDGAPDGVAPLAVARMRKFARFIRDEEHLDAVLPLLPEEHREVLRAVVGPLLRR